MSTCAEEETEARERQDRRRRKSRRTARMGYPVLRALAATWREQWDGAEHIFGDPASEKVARPSILSIWHRGLIGGSWIGRNRGLGVMVSEHGDGEMITEVIERFGFSTYRGSSTRGGARALLQMMRVPLETVLVLTVDGPRGPAEEVKDGAIVLAARSGRAIAPTGFAASRAWRARSWDRLEVPKPFARIALATTELVDVPKSCLRDLDERAHYRELVKQRVNAAHVRASDLVAGRD